MLIYGHLAAHWYRLLDPLEDHRDEAACYREHLVRAATGPVRTLLELGAGAGNNAFYLKQRFECTLTDRAPEMLALSQSVNPECRHELGDMRSLRLSSRFDVVFVHDAVMYITTEQDLRLVADTAFAHTRPGGAVLFAPDCVLETFEERTELYSGERGERAMRCIEWSWDPDPRDTISVVDYVFALREGVQTAVHHDRHVEGLFSRQVWTHTLEEAGFEPETASWFDEGRALDMFIGRRPTAQARAARTNPAAGATRA